MYSSIGRLRYSPKLIGDRSEKWWIILDCDPELGRYYRHLYKLGTYVNLGRPSWKEHITVVRDEEPADQYKKLWDKYNGETITFNYSAEIKDNESYYWLDVKCQRMTEIRLELGLPEIPEFPYHITIGNNPILVHKV